MATTKEKMKCVQYIKKEGVKMYDTSFEENENLLNDESVSKESEVFKEYDEYFEESENLLNDESVSKDLKSKKKGFNKNKIVKSIYGIGMAACLIGAAGIDCLRFYDAFDSTIDHTEEICPITVIENSIYSVLQPNKVSQHQLREMEKDFEDKGYQNVDVTEGYWERVEKEDWIEPIKEQKPAAPEGYDLKFDEFGKPYCIKRAYLQVGKDEEIPTGYTLFDEDANGNKICYRDVYAEPIFETFTTLPLGYMLEYNEELGKNVGVTHYYEDVKKENGYTIDYGNDEQIVLYENDGKLTRER